MSVVNNSINQGGTGTLPPGDPTNQTWNFTGTFGVNSPNAIAIAGSAGSSYTDSATITLDTPDLLIGLTLCTNLGIGNSATGIYGACNLWQLSSSGPINMSGSTGSSYSDVVSLEVDSPSLGIGNTLATSLTMGNNACALSGTFETVSMVGTSGSSYTDDVSMDLDSVTINFATTLCTTLNFGSSSLPLVINTSTFNLTTAGALDWTIGGYMQLGAVDGFVFSGGAGSNLEFNSPQTSFLGDNMDFYPSNNLTMGTATAPMFFTGAYILLNTPSGGFINIDMLASGGNINIGQNNASVINQGNTSCTVNITGSITTIMAQTDLILDSVDNTGRMDLGTNNANAMAIGSSGCNVQITCSDVSSISSAGSFTIFTVTDFVVDGQSGTISLSGGSGSEYTDAVNLEVDSVTLDIGSTLATSINISNTSCVTSIDGTSLNIQNLSAATGGTAWVPQIPSGYTFVIQNISTGKLYTYVSG